MRRTLRPVALAGLVVGLASGCAPADDGAAAPGAPTTVEARLMGLTARVAALGQRGMGDAGVPLSAGIDFSPEAIAADQDAYRFVQINALGLSEPAGVIQANGPEITLALQSGPTAAYDAGILTATRGFGDDLLTIDAPGLLAALRAGGGQVTRRTETLDAQDQVVTRTFACTVSSAGSEEVDLGLRQVEARRLDEACRGESLGFDNIYWLDGAGDVISSRQYVSLTVAYLRANRL